MTLSASEKIRRNIEIALAEITVGSTWDSRKATSRFDPKSFGPMHRITAAVTLDPEYEDQARGYVPDDSEESR